MPVYYNKSVPAVNDIVFVSITKYADTGTYCELLEYNNLEGLILDTELDRRSRDDKRSIRIADKKKFRFDSIYCASVVNVTVRDLSTTVDNVIVHDFSTTVDLSYRKVDLSLREQLVENFGYISKIKILSDELSFLSGIDIETAYNQTIRLLNFGAISQKDTCKNMYFDFLKNPASFVEVFKLCYPDQANAFLQNMTSRVTFTKMTVEQPFELLVYGVDAITKLKEILTYDTIDTNNTTMLVECISSPKYKITASCHTLAECNKQIEECFEVLKQRASKYQTSIGLLPRKNTDGKDDVDGIVKQQDIYIRRVNMQPNHPSELV